MSKPQKLKEIQGTLQKCRTNTEVPLIPPVLSVQPPEKLDLSESALDVWNFYIHDLVASGIIGSIDLVMFAVYCEETARYLEYKKILKSENPVIKTEKGLLIPNPYTKLLKQTIDSMVILAKHFGLTPLTRDKITTLKAKEQDTTPDYLK